MNNPFYNQRPATWAQQPAAWQAAFYYAEQQRLSLLNVGQVLPGKPTGLTHTAKNESSVSLSWTAPASGATPTDYVVEYKRAVDGSWSTFSHAAQTSTTITVTGLTDSTSYNFRVTASAAGVLGDASDVYTVSTDALALLLWDAAKSSTNASITNGGLDYSRGTGISTARVATLKTSGKWYCEAVYTARVGNDSMYGFSSLDITRPTEYVGNFLRSCSVDNTTTKYWNGIASAAGASMAANPTTWALNDVVMWAFDQDAKKGWIGKNGTWWGGQDPASGTNPLYTWFNVAGINVVPTATHWMANTLRIQNTLSYSPPSGFSQLRN